MSTAPASPSRPLTAGSLLRRWSGSAKRSTDVIGCVTLVDRSPVVDAEAEQAAKPTSPAPRRERLEDVALWTAGITVVAASGLLTILGLFLLASPSAAAQIKGLDVFEMTQWAVLATVIGVVCLWDKATRDKVDRIPAHERELQRAAKALQQAIWEYELALDDVRRCTGTEADPVLRKVAPYISEHVRPQTPAAQVAAAADGQQAAIDLALAEAASPSPSEPTTDSTSDQEPVAPEPVDYKETVRIYVVKGANAPKRDSARPLAARQPSSANEALFDPRRLASAEKDD